MAPTLMEAFLSKRYTYNCDPNLYDCSDNSTWDNWGRWVALAVIVVAFVLFALALSCFNNRRRRRRGAPPMYGTGWMPYGNKYYGGQTGQSNYYGNQHYNGGPAPPYEQPINNHATGNTFNSNDGYYGGNHGYGGQQSGIELQQPTSAYQPQRGGDPVYEAPHGPPPGKSDYIVR